MPSVLPVPRGWQLAMQWDWVLPGLREAMARPVGIHNCLVGVASGLLGVACRDVAPPQEFVDPLVGKPRLSETRTFRSEHWDTVLVVGGKASDTTLLRPRLIATGRGKVVAFDYGDRAVKAFDLGGHMLWRFGRRGSGPGEFQGAFDLDVAEDGSVWVLDPDQNRLTVITAEGTLDTVLYPSTELISAVALMPPGAMVLTRKIDPFWLRIDQEGRLLAQGRTPAPSLERIPPFARHPLAASAPRGEWVVVFPYGNLLLVYERDRLKCMERLIDARDFPASPIDSLPFTLAALAVWDSTAVVLADGGGHDRLRVLDTYSLRTCAYRGSLLLPRRFSALAIDGNTFVLEYEEPSPTLLGIRPKSEPGR